MEAAAILGDREARALDLALAGLAAQLRHQLEDLPEAGRADRVALRFQPAGRVDRDPSAERRLAALGDPAALAEGAEAEILRLHHLREGRGVVDLGHVHLLGPDPGALIGLE